MERTLHGGYSVCACVCVFSSIAKWLDHRPGNRKVPGSMLGYMQIGAFVVSLSKKLYSHCSSLPSCILGTWWPGVNWGSSPPSCNINGYLVLTEEVNVNCPFSHGR